MNDRAIGYTVIIAVILLLVAPISYLILQTSTPKTYRTISFTEVNGLSFLALLDPVRMQGVEIGVVKKINRNDEGTLVTIETNRDATVYENYSIQVMSKGVMGDRYLTINPGTPGRPEVPPTVLLRGSVTVGPDEALSYVPILKDAVHRLTLLSNELAQGTHEKRSLIAQLNTITTSIDTLAGSLFTTFMLFDTTIGGTVSKITGMISDASTLVNDLSDSLPINLSRITVAAATLDTVLIKTDSLLRQLNPVLNAINDPNMLLWQEYHEEIESSLLYLRNLLHEVASDSFTIPVRLW